MATEFRTLLRKLSQQLNQYDVEVIVASARLPSELREQSAEKVLAILGGNGDLSISNLDAVMEAVKHTGRNDLFKEVKAFKKKSRKKLMADGSGPPPPPPSAGNCDQKSFDVAEREAYQLLNTLERLEGAEAVVGVDRIKELHSQAKELAENLLRVVRRANWLSRTCNPPSQAGSEPRHSPPSSSALTSSTECSDVVLGSSPPSGTGGFRERLTRRLQGSSKPKLSRKERTPSPKSQRKINRSQSERVCAMTRTQPSTTTLPLPSPPRAFEEAGSDSEDDYHDYELTDQSLAMEQTLPQQVPQRQQVSSVHSLPRRPISGSGGNSFGNRDNSFAVPRKNSQTKNGVGQEIPPPPNDPPNLSDSDLEYEDVIGILDMQHSEKSSGTAQRSKPQSLHGEGARGGHFPRNEQSSTCSTPSSEVTTPPATLPKPSAKGKGTTSDTPAIPIRQSSLKSGQQATTAPSGSVHSHSHQSGMVQPSRSETTTPNQPIVDIQQQLRDAFRLKQTACSPQSVGSSSCGGSERVSPHPVSLAKALEMSNNQGFNSDFNDSCNCTGDSGFDEFSAPISAAWHKAAPLPRPKPKSLRQHSVEQQQQSYTNIPIISPTSPHSPPHHTSISHLAPVYGSNTTTPSPPSSSDHTTISAVAPMYNAITIEEQSPESDDEDGCPDYVNVKQYVEPT